METRSLEHSLTMQTWAVEKNIRESLALAIRPAKPCVLPACHVPSGTPAVHGTLHLFLLDLFATIRIPMPAVGRAPSHSNRCRSTMQQRTPGSVPPAVDVIVCLGAVSGRLVLQPATAATGGRASPKDCGSAKGRRHAALSSLRRGPQRRQGPP